MTPDPQQAKAIFLAALEHAGDKRSAFLDEACAGAPALRARVEQLLEAHERPDSLVNPAASPQGTVDSQPNVGQTAAAPLSLAEVPGTSIGPYKLLEQIGEGGMGTVWMAEQHQPLRRRVALKVIKPGMDSKQVLGRFDAERQALALMDHPNIARVLDAGATPAGRPYFVMELVKGVPLTKYCDEKRLPPRERLELFVSVCHAVQHAHQKGIIHRDLKPSNVLVAPYDGKPVVKVIDFGVAKATGQQLTERTLFTGFGAVVGTLEYMSPEQAELNNNDIDTRSDIYSLGVLLYELLTGSTPLTRKQCKEAALLEVLRLVREQESAKPSTRLSSTDELPAIAANRGLEPKKLSNLVRGELDWIVMKALEKDRNRRYETANGFAMDLQRYLADEPVQACPPSAGYRFKKMLRRNKRAVLVALTILVLLVAGIVGTTIGLVRAVNEAEGKEQARQAAEANFQRARAAVDEFYTLVSESTLFDLPGLQPVRLDLLDKAARYYQEMAELRGNDASALAGLALAQLRLGHVYHLVGRNDECITILRSGLDNVARLRREHPSATEHHRKLAGYFKGYRPVERRTAIPKDEAVAYRVLTDHVELWGDFVKEFPDEPGFQTDLAAMYFLLGAFEGARRRFDECLDASQKSIAMLERRLRQSPKDPLTRSLLALGYNQLRFNLKYAGRPGTEDAADRSLALVEQLAADFPNVPQYQLDLADNLSNLGIRLARGGRHDDAAAAFRRSLQILNDMASRFPSVTSFSATQARNLQGLIPHLRRTGKLDEAEATYRQAIEANAKFVAANPNELRLRQGLVSLYRELRELLAGMNRAPDAEQADRQRIAVSSKGIELWPKDATFWMERGRAYLFLNEPNKTLDDFSKALAIAPPTGDTPWWYFERAGVYVGLKQNDKALRDLEKAIEIRPELWDVWVWRGNFYFSHQDWHKAIADFTKAIDLNAPYPPAWYSRGTAYANLEQWDRAILDYSKVVEFDPKEPSLLNTLVWLLATCPDTKLRQPARALVGAKKTIELAPDAGPPYAGRFLTTLGVAHYRAGDWKAAIEALTKSMKVSNGGDSVQWFFFSMAHWKLDQKKEARKWYDQAVQWMEKNAPQHEELWRFRAEAAELLGIKTKESK